MTKTVLVIVNTKPAVFPIGTTEQPFNFKIQDLAGNVLSQVDTLSSGASFPLVPEGKYVASVSKQGFTATASFEVVATEVIFGVPDTLTVTLS